MANIIQRNNPSVPAQNGWSYLLRTALCLGADALFLIYGHYVLDAPLLVIAIAGINLYVAFLLLGFFTLEPNVMAVVTFIDKNMGTLSGEGFLWRNPFLFVSKISLRTRVDETGIITTNDKLGTPIVSGIQAQWRVSNAEDSVFNIERNGPNYLRDFVVKTLSVVLRQVISEFVYDASECIEGTQPSLSNSLETVNMRATELAQQYLIIAGIQIDRANLYNTSYSPEIAQVMLQKQQAPHRVAALAIHLEGLTQITKNVVARFSSELSESQGDSTSKIELNMETKQKLVVNILTALSGTKEVQPTLPLI